MYLGIFFYTLVPVALLLIQLFPDINPVLYYIVKTSQGFAGWFLPMFAIVSDVSPPHIRAFALSIVIVTTEAGIPVIPAIASVYGNIVATIVAVFFCVLGFMLAVFLLPETVSTESKEKAIQKRADDPRYNFSLLSTLFRIAKGLTIINRNFCLRLLSFVYVLSEMMKQGIIIVILFYVEEQLGFSSQDVATYVSIHSITGITVQIFLLNFLIQRIGERKVLLVALSIGVIFCFMYGIAEGPTLIYVAAMLSSVAGMAFATVSTIMTFNVEKHELGTIQGSFQALQSISQAFGPRF